MIDSAGNKRVEQLSRMFASVITEISLSEAKKIITETPTGKAILANNQMLLYEQQTSNLHDIAAELPFYQNSFTPSVISSAMQQLAEDTSTYANKINLSIKFHKNHLTKAIYNQRIRDLHKKYYSDLKGEYKRQVELRRKLR